MSLKRFFVILFIAVIFFVAGVLVGRFVMPRTVVMITIDIKEVVDIIERYNEAKWEFEEIKKWNENAIIESEPEEQESEKNN